MHSFSTGRLLSRPPLNTILHRAATYLGQAQRFTESLANMGSPPHEAEPPPPAPSSEPALKSSPIAKVLTRTEKALLDIDPRSLGLEIGPSHHPMAPKSAGYNVETIDHASAADLRKKYANTEGVDVSRIEEVDYVWQGEDLDEILPAGRKYDWILASHVIEHVPDLLFFLQQCGRRLTKNGLLSLVVPDKRYCFDYFRWPCTTGSVLQAWHERRRRHPAGVVYDMVALSATRDRQVCWGPGVRGELAFLNPLSEAKRFFEEAQTSPEYIDGHAWQFTPGSFRLIVAELQHLGLLKMELVRFFPTEGCEFYAALRPSEAPPVEIDRIALYDEALRDMAAMLKD